MIVQPMPEEGNATARRQALAGMVGGGETGTPRPEGGALEPKVDAVLSAIDDLSASLSGEKAQRLDEIASEIQTLVKEGP